MSEVLIGGAIWIKPAAALHSAQSSKQVSKVIHPKYVLKDSFFSESVIRFSNLQKRIFQKTILNLRFKFPANNSKVLLAGNLNFKFRIVFWNIFFGDLEFEKHITLSEKSHLYFLTALVILFILS